MRRIATLAAFVATLLLAPACAKAQVGQIDGRIASTFGGEIDTSSKANGYVLTYQSSSGKWIAAAASGGSATLDDLTDVTITSAASGNVLRYNGSSWVNATTSTVLDTIGSTRGSVLYRGASGWAILSPGTSGYFLKSNGAGADPSWASAGGGGGFDPAAATAITFVDGIGNDITGPTDTVLTIVGNVNGSGFARGVSIYGADGGAATRTGADVGIYGGSGNTSGQGGFINANAGQGGDTGDGGDIYLTSGGGGTTSGASGSIYFNIPGPTAGNSGGFGFSISDAAGTNKSAGDFSVQLGAKTGSGTNSSFLLKGASAATVFKVAYDGTLTITGTSTGSGTCTLGTNSPASGTPTAWQKVTLPNGHTGYFPVWE